MNGSRPGLFGHPFEWRDGDRLADEPVDVGGEGAELVGLREPQEGGGLGLEGALKLG